MSYHAARALLPSLNKSELTRLRAEISALLALPASSNGSDADDGEAAFALSAIAEQLASVGEPCALPRLLTHRDRPKFNQQFAAIDDFFKRAGLDKLQRRSLFRIGVRLLYQNLAELNVPASAVTLMHHVHRIPSLLDRQLPGYAESGLLRLVVPHQLPAAAPRTARQDAPRTA